MSLRNWWNSKTLHKKHNWLLIALACCLVAGGMVEVYSWMALVGVVPAGVMIGLEVMG